MSNQPANDPPINGLPIINSLSDSPTSDIPPPSNPPTNGPPVFNQLLNNQYLPLAPPSNPTTHDLSTTNSLSNNPPTSPLPPQHSLIQPPATPKPIISALAFWVQAQHLLTTRAQNKYRLWPERNIAYDIAVTLMLAGIYLDQRSSVDESAAWVEWAFSVKGIWKRRPIWSILNAVPPHLWAVFRAKYRDGKIIPVVDGFGDGVKGKGKVMAVVDQDGEGGNKENAVSQDVQSPISGANGGGRVLSGGSSVSSL
jgi:hypothetical protein